MQQLGTNKQLTPMSQSQQTIDSKKKQKRFNLIFDIGIALFLFIVFLLVRPSLMGMITPFVYALVVAFLLNPAVSFFEKRGLNRILSIVIVFLLIAAIMTGIIMSFVPRLAQDVSVLAQDIPSVVKFVEQFIADFREGNLAFMPDFIFEFVDIDEELANIGNLVRNSLDNLYSALIASTGTLLNLILTPIITFYYLKDKDKILKFIMGLISLRFHYEVRAAARDIKKVLGGFIRGQLIVAAFVGILTGVGCLVIGVPHALTIGLVAGVTNIIPYFGPWIGGIMPVVLALMNQPILALWVIIWIVIVQQVESSFISPQVMAHSVGLHPLLVIFSVLFFGSLFGITGMILGVPITASVKVLARYVLLFRNRYRQQIITSR